DGRRTGFDSYFNDLAEKVPIAASGICCRELDCRAEIASIAHHCFNPLERLLATDTELMLKMDVGSGMKHMDHRPFRIAEAPPGCFDINLIGAGEASDGDAMSPARNLFDSFKITRRGGRKACFNNVDVEAHKLLCYLELFFDSHRSSW